MKKLFEESKLLEFDDIPDAYDDIEEYLKVNKQKYLEKDDIYYIEVGDDYDSIAFIDVYGGNEKAAWDALKEFAKELGIKIKGR